MKKKSILITVIRVIHITLCVFCSLVLLGIIAGVVYINLTGVGGYHYSFSLGVGTSKSYSFSVWISTHNAYIGGYSSFFIRQDIETLTDTIASKKDRHGKRLQTAIYQEKYILITQESAENGKNYYIVAADPYFPRGEEERIEKGAHFYGIYTAEMRFKNTFSEPDERPITYRMAIPYHLLYDLPRNWAQFDFDRFAAGYYLTGSWEDIGAFYDSITSYEVTRPDAGTLAVTDKATRFALKIVLSPDGSSLRLFPEYP